MEHFEFGPPATPEEVQSLARILHQCFNFPLDDWQTYADRLGLENSRVLRCQNRVVAGLGIYPMGQWFGGQSVPIAGLAAVGVAPEQRGTGVARALLHRVLKDCQAHSLPLSTLYASTQRLYRKVGYEQAGSACRFSLPTASLVPQDRTLPLFEADSQALPLFQSLYRQRAQGTNGNLERHPAIWKRIVEPHPPVAVYSYGIGPRAQPEGYIVFTQEAAARGYNLQVRDWVTLTPRATQRLLTFWADHRSLAQEIHWVGPGLEPLLLLLPEQTYRAVHLERWLLRVVDVPQALELRGYPVGVEAELHLQVEDPLLSENCDRFILKVSAGRGTVIRGGRGELTLEIGAMAPLYTGFLTAHQLQSLGRLEAPPTALATASQIFAGPEPWMPDHF